MRAKRALIVDDSKSARLFLSRILVQHAIEVETVESAEAAIEFLADHRPDVIFMDHQMPGMDGLQAVRAIKNNPITATIPIMMYTSQEGELYLGQARALGAVGVMPKQIRQADVSKVLYELRLLPERRSRERSEMRPVSLDALADAAAEKASVSGIHEMEEGLLREQLGELRRTLLSSIDTQSDRIVANIQALHTEPAAAAPSTAPPRQPPLPWLVTAIALTVAFMSILFWWRESDRRHEIGRRLQEIRAANAKAASSTAATPAMRPIGAAPSDPARTIDALAGNKPVVIPVPYGEDPLSAARLTTLRQLFRQLTQQKFRGVVDVRSFPGRFCLIGNATDGYSLAPEETLYAKCDAVGNPEATEFAQREPLPFANLVGELRKLDQGRGRGAGVRR